MTKKAAPEIVVYGIRNCDTIKKSRAWLDAHGVAHGFHDYKTQGVTPEQLQRWCKALGWEKVLNRAGTTFRKLPQADRENLDEQKAIALMLAQPSMIKRPVVETGARVHAGFSDGDFAKLFG